MSSPRQKCFQYSMRHAGHVAWLGMGLVLSLIPCGCRETIPEPGLVDDHSDIAPPTAQPTPVVTGGIELPPVDALEAAMPAKTAGDQGIALPNFSQPAPETDSESAIEIASWSDVLKRARSSPVVLIDLWSLSCPPCMAEFPGLVSLHQELGDQVDCVAVSVDYDGRKNRPPTSYEEEVSKFLASVKSGDLPVVICSTPIDDVLGAVDVGSIPTVLVFKDGQLTKTFVDAGETRGFSYERDIGPMLRELLQD